MASPQTHRYSTTAKGILPLHVASGRSPDANFGEWSGGVLEGGFRRFAGTVLHHSIPQTLYPRNRAKVCESTHGSLRMVWTQIYGPLSPLARENYEVQTSVLVQDVSWSGCRDRRRYLFPRESPRTEACGEGRITPGPGSSRRLILPCFVATNVSKIPFWTTSPF